MFIKFHIQLFLFTVVCIFASNVHAMSSSKAAVSQAQVKTNVSAVAAAASVAIHVAANPKAHGEISWDSKIITDAFKSSSEQLSAKQLEELMSDPTEFKQYVFLQESRVMCVAINKQKTLIAIGHANGLTYIYGFKTGELIEVIANDNPLASTRCLKFHPTKNHLVVGYSIIKKDLALLKALKAQPLYIDGKSYKFMINADPNYLLYVDLDAKKQYDLEGHTDWVNDIDFSPDGFSFGTISDDFSHILWSSLIGNRRTKHHQNYVRSISFNADNTCLVTAGFDGYVHTYFMKEKPKKSKQWNTKARSENFGLRYLPHQDTAVAVFHPTDPAILAIAGTDNNVCLYNVNTDRVVSSIALPIEEVMLDGIVSRRALIVGLSFNEDGTKLACMKSFGRLLIWDYRQNKASHAIKQVQFPFSLQCYGTFSFVNNTVYAGYAHKPDRSGPKGFVFKWNADIDHGK